MKVVLLSYTVLVQINCIPVELCVCKKDLQFRAISNHSDWGTFSELKCSLSYIFFKTILTFRILNNCFIVFQNIRIDAISFLCTSEEKMHHFQSEDGGCDRGREAKLRISNFPRF